MEALARRSTTPNRQLRNSRAKVDRILECYGSTGARRFILKSMIARSANSRISPMEHRQMPHPGGLPRLFGGTHFADARAPAARPRRSPVSARSSAHCVDRLAGRIGSTPTVRMQHGVYRDETLYESDARCSNRNRQIQ